MKQKSFAIITNSVVIIVGRGIEIVTVLIGAILVARFLGVEGYGNFVFIQAVGMAVMPFIGWGAFKILIRDISVDTDKTGSLVSTMFLLNLMAVTILLVGTWVFFLFRPSSDPTLQTCIYLVFISQTFMVMQKNIFAVFIATERVFYFSLLQVGQRITMLSMYLVVIVLHLELAGLFWAMIVSNVLILGIAWIVLQRIFPVSIPNLRLKIIRYLVKESYVLMLSDLIYQVHTYVNVFFLKFLSTIDQITFLQIPQRIMTPLQIIPNSVLLTVFPMFSQLGSYSGGHRKLAKGYQDAVRYLIVFCLPICAIISIYAERIITILFGKEFNGAVLPLQLIIWSLCIFTIVNIIEDILIALKRQRIVTLIKILCLITNVITALILIPKYGAVGAIIAIILGTVVQFVILNIIITQMLEGTEIFLVLLKPLISCGFMIGTIYILQFSIHVVFLIPLSLCIYLGLLWMSGCLSIRELYLIKELLQTLKKKIKV